MLQQDCWSALLCAPSVAWSQTAAQKAAPAPAAAAPAPAAAAPAQPRSPPAPPATTRTRLASARTVEIDTTGGPGFGFEHFKELDFLKDKEVVLTFDDGPWEKNTPAILKALADECTTGIFFEIGKHATYYPEIAKQVYAAGHTIGTHTWSHEALVNKKLSEDQRKEEIEKGISAVKWALGGVSPSLVLPLPGAAASAGDGHLSRHAQYRDLLLRRRFLRLQVPRPEEGHRTSSSRAWRSRAKASS